MVAGLGGRCGFRDGRRLFPVLGTLWGVPIRKDGLKRTRIERGCGVVLRVDGKEGPGGPVRECGRVLEKFFVKICLNALQFLTEYGTIKKIGTNKVWEWLL